MIPLFTKVNKTWLAQIFTNIKYKVVSMLNKKFTQFTSDTGGAVALMCQTAHDGASGGAIDGDGNDETLAFLTLFLVAFCPRLSKTCSDLHTAS